MPTLTLYPNWHPETVSFDGLVYHNAPSQIWSTKRNQANGSSAGGTGESSTIYGGVSIKNDPSFFPNQYYAVISRSIFLFTDTSLIGQSINVTSASFKGTVYSASYPAPWAKPASFNPTIGLVNANPASNTAIAVGDYSTLGTVLFSDTTPAVNDHIGASILSPIVFTLPLNAAGKLAVQNALTADGVIKLGLREATYDRTGTEPTWTGGWVGFHWKMYFAESGYPQADLPTLEIEYETSAGPSEVNRRVRGRLLILRIDMPDSSSRYYSAHDVRHPDWFAKGKVTRWGNLSRSIGLKPGSPIYSDLVIRLSEFD